MRGVEEAGVDVAVEEGGDGEDDGEDGDDGREGQGEREAVVVHDATHHGLVSSERHVTATGESRHTRRRRRARRWSMRIEAWLAAILLGERGTRTNRSKTGRLIMATDGMA